MTVRTSSSQLVLLNGLILADPDDPEVVPHGRTTIHGDRLVEVNVPLHPPQPDDVVINCSNCLILPGLVNAHTHAAMSLLRGLADDLPLAKWLNEYIFPAEARHARPDFVYLGTKLSAMEMALAGVTTFADGYFYMEEAARAASDVGLRAVIAQGILDIPSPDAPAPGSWKDRVRQFLADFPKDSLVRPALFCHSPYHCAPDTFRQAAELALQNGTLLFAHMCETQWEVDESCKRYGSGPVELLNNLGVLGKSFVAVHAIHVSDADVGLLAESGTAVVHCPESNMKLASGAARVKDLVARGVTVGIGTDGPASNNNLDLFEEMRCASLLAKLISNDPEALGAPTVLRMATSDGARLLGMDDKIGSLVPGKLADVIVVDLDRPHLTPVYDPLSHLVYSARGSDVRHVLVNGRLVVDHGRIMSIDERQLKHEVRAKAEEIGRSLGLKMGLGAQTKDD